MELEPLEPSPHVNAYGVSYHTYIESKEGLNKVSVQSVSRSGFTYRDITSFNMSEILLNTCKRTANPMYNIYTGCTNRRV